MLGLAFHHIGVACSDIDRAADFILRTHVIVSDTGTIFDSVQNAQVRLFNDRQPGAIELVSGPAVAKVLRHQTTYYHVCYATQDLGQTLDLARQAGMLLVSPPKEAILFGGRRVAFVFGPLGFVEFLEVE